MNLKNVKNFLRFPGWVGTYKTHQEKKKNSDPEIQEYIRPKRKPNQIIDGYTDTKWITKIHDKSWKTRCKKRHQYEKHKMSPKEIEYCLHKTKEYKSRILLMSKEKYNKYEDIKQKFDNAAIFDESMNQMLRDGIITFHWEECGNRRVFFYHLKK